MADHWRLVLSNGVVVDVETRAHWFYSNLLYAACAWEGSTSGATPEVCVVDLASQVTRLCCGFRLGVHVSEIVAPGLMTKAERCIAIVESRVSEIAEALALPPGRRPDDHVYRARQREALDELRMVRDRMRGVL